MEVGVLMGEKGDSLHNFIVLCSFLEQYLYVSNEYEIPESGELTAVYLDYKVY